MEIQYLNLKIYTKNEKQPPSDDFIMIFHNWIQNTSGDELLIDVADYSNVTAGPGVMLIGHEANYSVEYGPEERFGLLYNTKMNRDGSNQDRIRYAFKQIIQAGLKLENDQRLKSKIEFGGQELQLTLNRRSLSPNNETTFNTVKGDMEAVLSQIYPDSTYSINRTSTDPRERFSIQIKINNTTALSQLWENIVSG